MIGILKYFTFILTVILHTFRVNRNLKDTGPVYVASGMSETNA